MNWRPAVIFIAFLFFFFLGLPIIIRPPRDASVISNANVSFYCEGLGSPEPKLSWLKDASVIKQSKNIFIDVEKGELKLYMVSTSDVAKYTCVYRNSNGEVKKSAVLIVDGVEPRQCKFHERKLGLNLDSTMVKTNRRSYHHQLAQPPRPLFGSLAH